jgi:hypothetical protein
MFSPPNIPVEVVVGKSLIPNELAKPPREPIEEFFCSNVNDNPDLYVFGITYIEVKRPKNPPMKR